MAITSRMPHYSEVAGSYKCHDRISKGSGGDRPVNFSGKTMTGGILLCYQKIKRKEINRLCKFGKVSVLSTPVFL